MAERSNQAGSAGSSSSGTSARDETEWLDVEPEQDDAVEIVSLLDDKKFPSIEAMLKHNKESHAFDFLAVRSRLGLDFYGTIKLVNFVRQHARDKQPLPETITAADIEDDLYLKPVLADDALIFSLDELDDLDAAAAASSGAGAGADDSLAQQNRKLQEELEAVRSQFSEYRVLVEKTLDKRWGDDQEAPAAAAASSSDSKADPSKPKDSSQYYWESYANNDIHETMLKDAIRSDAYRDFVYDNKAIFKDKVVLDIGCGTGILSMFCAKAGAKMVIAVDNSEIIDKARANVFQNNLTDTVTCIKGRIEDITLPVEKVDIIISEWMGYCLLYEAMLNSVLWARDNYLAPDGILAPSFASIWVAPVSDPEFVSDHISFWDDVYGFDMTAMKVGIHGETRVDVFPASTVCGTPAQIAHFDLHTVTAKDLDFKAKWESTVDRDVDSLDGFLVWFDIFFTQNRSESVPAGLEAKPRDEKAELKPFQKHAFTTDAFHTETHWKQGFLSIDRTKAGAIAPVKANTALAGEIVFQAPAEQPRALDITTSWGVKDSPDSRSQTWVLR